MAWKSFVSQSATLASRPKVLTTTFMCALSATVRLTSTTGEATRIPVHPAHMLSSMSSIMIRDSVPIFCRGRRLTPARRAIFQSPPSCRAWPL